MSEEVDSFKFPLATVPYSGGISDFLEFNPLALRARITRNSETALHIAAGTRHTRFVEKLVNLMKPEDLALQNKVGNTALCFAAVSGIRQIAEVMVNKCKTLPLIRGSKGALPLYMDALLGLKDMVLYLYSVTEEEIINEEDRIGLLIATITANLFDEEKNGALFLHFGTKLFTALLVDLGAKEALVGVLLYGPPGTGKTVLVRAVAHHIDCTFIRVSGSELVQKYIGEGSRMVRELFVMAREHAPSIIFMDEIDSIGSARMESGSGNGDNEVQRTMLELLNQLDGFETSNKIKVLIPCLLNDASHFIVHVISFSVDLARGRIDKVDVTLQPEELEVMNNVLHAKYEEARRRRSCVVSGRISVTWLPRRRGNGKCRKRMENRRKRISSSRTCCWFCDRNVRMPDPLCFS
ncbi:hypothetical protein LOK49_LG10G00773 [Camellia lanceoleosa]|uniref:Uncharacterized protein n=1 Tax=Camellia lanceoleosa TaxID=1840588 RepID=A0ACC0GBV0_9ERIC|nr:hypothetical protein LOK49_LG10G00773 [Camellia lanceoleosa]